MYIRGWLIITTITDAISFLHSMEALKWSIKIPKFEGDLFIIHDAKVKTLYPSLYLLKTEF